MDAVAVLVDLIIDVDAAGMPDVDAVQTRANVGAAAPCKIRAPITETSDEKDPSIAPSGIPLSFITRRTARDSSGTSCLSVGKNSSPPE
jgi:hypothetical protein